MIVERFYEYLWFSNEIVWEALDPKTQPPRTMAAAKEQRILCAEVQDRLLTGQSSWNLIVPSGSDSRIRLHILNRYSCGSSSNEWTDDH